MSALSAGAGACSSLTGATHTFPDFVHTPFHRGKFLQQQRLSREVATGKHHIITDPRDVDNIFEPLKWLHQQGEPAAVGRRTGLLAVARS